MKRTDQKINEIIEFLDNLEFIEKLYIEMEKYIRRPLVKERVKESEDQNPSAYWIIEFLMPVIEHRPTFSFVPGKRKK